MTTLAEIKARPSIDHAGVLWLVDRVERLERELAAKNAALMDLSQLAEEAGLVLRGVYRVARAAATDNGEAAE